MTQKMNCLLVCHLWLHTQKMPLQKYSPKHKTILLLRGLRSYGDTNKYKNTQPSTNIPFAWQTSMNKQQSKHKPGNLKLFSSKFCLQMTFSAQHYRGQGSRFWDESAFCWCWGTCKEIFTPVESQVQDTSQLPILKSHWKDVAKIHLALKELLLCVIL